MTFLLSEDEALKRYLKGTVRVADATDGSRGVPVYYGMPEKELRELTYPSVILELIDVAEATERVHVGPAFPWLTYQPDGFVTPMPAGHKTGMVHLPQPFDLIYQITTLARHPRHDRQMLATMNVGALAPRGAGIAVLDDHTRRRLDRVGFAKRDTVDENRKRIFRNVFTYRMSAELFPAQWHAITRTVDRVVFNGDEASPAPVNPRSAPPSLADLAAMEQLEFEINYP